MAKYKTPMNILIKPDFFGVSADIPRITEIRLEHIYRNPNQPRQVFDEKSLQELADSIAQKGLLQPIVVRRETDENYMVIAGERRFRAYTMLGKTTIPAIISDGDVDEIALIENIQRENLRPMELAEALSRLIETHQYTHEVAAKMLGKARNTVTELLSLNRINEAIRAECRTSDIASKSFLVELARMAEADQLAAWEQFKTGAGTVRVARILRNQGTDAPTELVGKRPKKVFNTKHGASVIIQAESPDGLSSEQIIAALTDALKAAKKLGTEL